MTTKKPSNSTSVLIAVLVGLLLCAVSSVISISYEGPSSRGRTTGTYDSPELTYTIARKKRTGYGWPINFFVEKYSIERVDNTDNEIVNKFPILIYPSLQNPLDLPLIPRSYDGRTKTGDLVEHSVNNIDYEYPPKPSYPNQSTHLWALGINLVFWIVLCVLIALKKIRVPGRSRQEPVAP